jgi:hypothetical protein
LAIFDALLVREQEENSDDEHSLRDRSNTIDNNSEGNDKALNPPFYGSGTIGDNIKWKVHLFNLRCLIFELCALATPFILSGTSISMLEYWLRSDDLSKRSLKQITVRKQNSKNSKQEKSSMKQVINIPVVQVGTSALGVKEKEKKPKHYTKRKSITNIVA